MITGKRWLALYILVFLGYNNSVSALTLDYSQDRFGVMEGVQTDTIFAGSDSTTTDTASQIRYNAGEDKWEYTNDGTNYYDLHTHANKATLDLIEEALTTVLKTLYDNTAADSHVQNTDQYLDQGGANEVTAANAKDAVTKKHSQNTDTLIDVTGSDTVGCVVFQSNVDTLRSDTNLFWDNINKRLGIGTTGPTAPLEISAANAYQYITSTLGSKLLLQANGNNDVRMGTVSVHPLLFMMNNVEKMRMDTAGNVGIGTSSPNSFYSGGLPLVVGSGSGNQGETIYSGADSYGAIYFADGTSGNERYRGQIEYSHVNDRLAFGTAGNSNLMVIDSAGKVGIGNVSPTELLQMEASGGGWYETSDHSWKPGSSIRWKENIKPLTNSLDIIKQLQGVSFSWKDSKRKSIGFVAEEVGKVIPEVVDYDETKSNFAKGMSYDKLTAVLVEGIKEQQAKIEELQKKMIDLEKQIIILKSK